MGFVKSAKGGRAPETKDARTAYAIQPQQAGKPYKDDWDIDRAMSQAMAKVIPIFRAVHAIADAQARLPFQVNQGGEDGPEIKTHDLVRILNQRANPDESAYTFRYRLTGQVLLSRKGAFVELVKDRLGNLRHAYLLDPRKTSPVVAKTVNTKTPASKDPTRLVESYEVDLGQGQKDHLDPENVIWFRLPHPFDPLKGLTPLEAAGLTIDIDVLARLYNRTFLQNDGRPGGIVGVKGDMDDDVAEELESRFNVGTRGAGRITVLEADGLDWVDTATSPRDAQYIQALAATKVDLLGAFGVPESIAYGNASQRTFDNVDAERYIFWDPTMLGHLALLGDGFNQADGSDETYSHFDVSGVDVLQRVEVTRRKEMREEVDAGVRTLDSYLEATGEEVVGSPEARSYFRPMGEVPYATEGEEATILSLVQTTADAAAKAAVAALEEKRRGVVTPFRYTPHEGEPG
jgi:HK97 family phage portal protein